MITAAILAGGLATRLRPLTETIPKSLVEVAGEPFIRHQLRLLAANGVSRAVVCAGHLGDQIQREVGDGDGLGLRVEYSFDGDRLLGTAGALRQALPRLADRFLVLYGDSYLECDYGAVWRAFLASGQPGLMTVYRNEGRWETSNVELEGGRIKVYDKRIRTPAMRHVDYGLGALRADVIASVPEGEPCDLADVYRRLVEAGALAAFEVSERFYEIGSPVGLEETRRHLGARGMAR